MKTLLLSAAFSATLIAGSSAAVVFSDSFSNLAGTGTATRPLSEGNWSGYFGNSTTPATTVTHNSGSHRAGVVKNTNGTAPNTVENYLFAQNQANSSAMSYFLSTTSMTVDGTTSGFSFTPANYTSLTATWNRNGNSVTNYFMTVQVNGQWYVSQTPFTSSYSNTFNMLTSTWANLVLDTSLTGSLAIGSTVSDYNTLFGAGQSVTGVGFYINGLAGAGAGSSSTIRIDEISIVGIPEASTSLLCITGALVLLTKRNRRIS